jgi:uncharacterized glyoxalase superfamily protein PhnB
MSEVRPIPEGMNTVTPHLVCRGAGRAIEIYKKAFGAQEIGRMDMPEGGKVLHAAIRIGNSVIMLIDEFPEWNTVSPQTLNGSPVTIHLYVENAELVFTRAVQAGATAIMPLEDMFWGDRYGKLQDPFGHTWSIATHTRDVSHEEMAQAAKEMFGPK